MACRRHAAGLFYIMATNSYDSIISDSLDYASDYSNDTTGQSIIGNFLMPGYQQQAEFGQQVALQQMQNEWNAAPNQMEQMKKAGINANVAAAGIAGAGNAPSAGAPNSAAGAGAAGVGAAAQLGEVGVGAANAFTAGKANLAAANASEAKAELDRANAKNVDALARAQIMEKVGVLADYFENNGADSIRASQLAITLGNGDWQTVLNILSSDDKIRKYDHQMRLLDNEAKNEEKRWHLINQQIETLKAQAGEAAANEQYLVAKKQHEDILKGIDTRKTEILDGLRRDPYFDQWQSLLWYAEKYGYDSDEYKNALNIIKDSYYWQHKGANKAEIEDAYEKFLGQFKAEYDVEADFEEYFSYVRQNEAWIKAYIQVALDTGGDLTSLYNRLVSMIAASLDADFGAGESRNFLNRMHSRPHRGNPNSIHNR